MGQHFPCSWNTSCCLLLPFHVFIPTKLLLSCPFMCSGVVSIFLPNSLSPLPPPVHFLLVFELTQEFPLGQSWPPAMLAWLPAHQNRLFCFEWWFLEVNQSSCTFLPQPPVASCLPVPWTRLDLLFQSSRSLLCYLPTSLLSGSLSHHPMMAVAKWCQSFTALTSSYWLTSSILSTASPNWLVCHFFQQLSSRIALLNCFPLCLLPSQRIMGLWKPLRRDRACYQKASPSRLWLISSTFSWVRWPVADIHHTIMLIGLLPHPDP